MGRNTIINTGQAGFPINSTDPTDGAAGDIQYNSATLTYKVYDTAWKDLATQQWANGAFILNQSGAIQSASFRINGTGRFEGSNQIVLAPNFSSATNTGIFASDSFDNRGPNPYNFIKFVNANPNGQTPSNSYFMSMSGGAWGMQSRLLFGTQGQLQLGNVTESAQSLPMLGTLLIKSPAEAYAWWDGFGGNTYSAYITNNAIPYGGGGGHARVGVYIETVGAFDSGNHTNQSMALWLKSSGAILTNYAIYSEAGRNFFKDGVELGPANLVLGVMASDTGTVKGSMYLSSASNKIRYYDGTAWGPIASEAWVSANFQGGAGTVYTAGTGISISGSNVISNTGVLSINGSAGAITDIATMTWANAAYAPISGSANYIQNQITTPQSGAGFNTTGQGIFSGFRTNDSSVRIGSIEYQSYSLNNAWFCENVYYNGGWIYRAAGFAERIYFQNGEISIACFNTGLAGQNIGTGGAYAQIKTYYDGTVSLGGSITTLPGSTTGAVMIIKSTGGVTLPITSSTITLGTTSAVSTTAPTTLDMGASYSPTAGANLKIKLFNDGSGNYFGFGVSSGSLDYVSGTSGQTKHTFYNGPIILPNLSAPPTFYNGAVYYNTSTGKAMIGLSGVYQVIATDGNSIQNQFSSAQTAQFWVSGLSRLDNSLMFGATATAGVDTNVLYTKDNTCTIGMIASSTASYLGGNGPYFGFRGNGYTTIAGQRGIGFMAAGIPSSPTGNEGTLVFFTQDTARLRVAWSGNILIGEPADSGIDRLQVNGSTQTNTLRVTAAATTDSIAKFGCIEIQPYTLNNAWFGENVYYNGSQFVRRAAGYSELFYFVQGEGQFRFCNTGAAGSTIPEFQTATQFKMNFAGWVALGGSISTAVGYTSGATLVASSTAVTISQPTVINTAAGTPFRAEATAGNITAAYKNTNSTGTNQVVFEDVNGTVVCGFGYANNYAGYLNGSFFLNSVKPVILSANATSAHITIATNGNVAVASLAGTGTRMVVADLNGILSTQAIPSGATPLTGHVMYVDKDSPNATDTRTGISAFNTSIPFKTIGGAMAAYTAGSLVIVRMGQYSENVTTPAGMDCYIKFEEGAFLNAASNAATISGSNNLFLFGPSRRLNPTGMSSIVINSEYTSATIYTTGTLYAYNMSINNNSSASAVRTNGNFYFSFCKLSSNTATECVWANGNGSCYVNDSYITSGSGYAINDSGGKIGSLTLINSTLIGPPSCVNMTTNGNMYVDNCRFYSANAYGLSTAANVLGTYTNAFACVVKNSYFNTSLDCIYVTFSSAAGNTLGPVEVSNCIMNARGGGSNAFQILGGGTSTTIKPVAIGIMTNKAGFTTAINGMGPVTGNVTYSLAFPATFPTIIDY
jgi:hypothetical protein